MRRALLPLLAAVALAGCASPTGSIAEAVSSSETPPTAETTPATPPLRDAVYACGMHVSVLMDGGETLMLDGAGEDDYPSSSSTHSMEEITCILGELDTPASIIAKMNSTRALDGMQTDSDGTFEYTWTFHPDNGIDIIITAIG
jgi:hypothetical protein